MVNRKNFLKTIGAAAGFVLFSPAFGEFSSNLTNGIDEYADAVNNSKIPVVLCKARTYAIENINVKYAVSCVKSNPNTDVFIAVPYSFDIERISNAITANIGEIEYKSISLCNNTQHVCMTIVQIANGSNIIIVRSDYVDRSMVNATKHNIFICDAFSELGKHEIETITDLFCNNKAYKFSKVIILSANESKAFICMKLAAKSAVCNSRYIKIV